jgi:hypothetical protein
VSFALAAATDAVEVFQSAVPADRYPHGGTQALLGFARPALTIAYEAHPAGFAGIWHAETGTDAPDWLTRPGGSAT